MLSIKKKPKEKKDAASHNWLFRPFKVNLVFGKSNNVGKFGKTLKHILTGTLKIVSGSVINIIISLSIKLKLAVILAA